MCNLDTKALTSSRKDSSSSSPGIPSTRAISPLSFTTVKKELSSDSLSETPRKVASGFSREKTLRTKEPEENIRDLNTSSSSHDSSFRKDKRESVESNPVQSLLRDLLEGTKVSRNKNKKVTTLTSPASSPPQEFQTSNSSTASPSSTSSSPGKDSQNRSRQNEYLTRRELEDQYLTSAIDLLEKLVADERPTKDERTTESPEAKARHEKSSERSAHEASQSIYSKTTIANKVTDNMTSTNETPKQESESNVTPSVSSEDVSSTTSPTSTIESSMITSSSHTPLSNVTTCPGIPCPTFSGYQSDNLFRDLTSLESQSSSKQSNVFTSTPSPPTATVGPSHVPSALLVLVDGEKLQSTTQTVVTKKGLQVERHDVKEEDTKKDERKVKEDEKEKKSQERKVEQLISAPTLKKEEKSQPSQSKDPDKKIVEEKQVTLTQKLNADQTQTRDQWSITEKGKKENRKEAEEDPRRTDMKSERLTHTKVEDPKTEDTARNTATETRLVFSDTESNSKNLLVKKVTKANASLTISSPDTGSLLLPSNHESLDQAKGGGNTTQGDENKKKTNEVTLPTVNKMSKKDEDKLRDFRDRKGEVKKSIEVQTEVPAFGNIHQSIKYEEVNFSSILNSFSDKTLEGGMEEESAGGYQEQEELNSRRGEDDGERRLYFSLESHGDHQSSTPHASFQYNKLTVYISSGISLIFLLVTFFFEMFHYIRSRNHPESLSSLFSSQGFQSSSNLMEYKADCTSKTEEEEDSKDKKKNICGKHKYFSCRSFILLNLLLVLTGIQLLFFFGFPLKHNISEQKSLTLRPVHRLSVTTSTTTSSRLTETERCYCYAFLLHFLHLSAGFWMLYHSIFLSSICSSSDSTKSTFFGRWHFRQLSIFSWFIPLVIIVVSYYLNPSGYEVKR